MQGVRYGCDRQTDGRMRTRVALRTVRPASRVAVARRAGAQPRRVGEAEGAAVDAVQAIDLHGRVAQDDAAVIDEGQRHGVPVTEMVVLYTHTMHMYMLYVLHVMPI